jgi:hypothetical protein
MTTASDQIDCLGCVIPERIERSIRSYVEHGVEPGGFVRAVLENDLQAAVQRADPDCFVALRSICHHIFNCIPEKAWGSRLKIAVWLCDHPGDMDFAHGQ